MELPWQAIVSDPAEAIGTGLITTFTSSVSLQPNELVTTNVYVPAILPGTTGDVVLELFTDKVEYQLYVPPPQFVVQAGVKKPLQPVIPGTTTAMNSKMGSDPRSLITTASLPLSSLCCAGT